MGNWLTLNLYENKKKQFNIQNSQRFKKQKNEKKRNEPQIILEG